MGQEIEVVKQKREANYRREWNKPSRLYKEADLLNQLEEEETEENNE